jgi:LPXTG-motif cell wall-anchored protein
MTQILSDLKPQKRSSEWLSRAGGLLFISGVVHALLMLGSGATWSGAVSLRKPVTFGISMGLALWTLGWVIDRLPSRPRREAILAWTLAGSGLIEVALITVQAWRGVPSHFNFTTATDSAVFAVMGVMILLFVVGFVGLTVWAVVNRPSDPSTRLVVFAGLFLMLLGLGIGQWVINLGTEMAESLGHAPDTVTAGANGVAKFPHAMGLHGIQLFIVALVGSSLAGLGTRARLQSLSMIVAGYTSLVAWSIIHTVSGRAPANVAGPEAVLMIAGIVLLLGGSGLILAKRRETVPGIEAPTARTPVTLPS